MTNNYKNLDVSASLKIGKPHKVNGVYQSDTLFKVQTPEVNVDLDNNTISFKMINKGKFVTLLEELENKIVSIIYKNSTDFFNGKTFTENKIRSCLEKLFSLDNNGVITLNNVNIPSNIKVYDHFNDIVNQGTIKGNVIGSCILQLDTIKFVKSVIKVNFILTHLKLSVEKKKLKECILDDDSDVETPTEKNVNPESVEVEPEYTEKNVEVDPESVEVEPEYTENVDPESVEVEEYPDFFEE